MAGRTAPRYRSPRPVTDGVGPTGPLVSRGGKTRLGSTGTPGIVHHAGDGTPVDDPRGTTMKRLTATTLTAAATALLLVGCSSGPDAALGDPLETEIWAASEFEGGTVSITADSVEPVSDETMASWELDAGDQDAYLARFTVRVVDGSWEQPADEGDQTGMFKNQMWAIGTDDGLVKGPARQRDILGGQSRESWEVCPDDGAAVKAVLAAGDDAEVCALLLAPGGSEVTEVGYANAEKDRGRRSMGGAKTITWSVG